MSHSYKNLGAVPLLLLFAAPLSLSFFYAVGGLINFDGWGSLLAHPQLWPALRLSLFTGLMSTTLSLVTAILIVAGLYQSRKITPATSAMLALPHVALAIGISFLIMPSGLLARVAAFFMGWQSPPNWVSTHDPFGLALILVLVLKETPFLIWILASLLDREDVRRSFAGQRAAALSLGHDVSSIWLRIFLPQILPKIMWPLLVTFVYAATVIDMSLVIGPTQPPTLAIVVWADINDAQVANNARGLAGAWFLTGALAVTSICVWGVVKATSLRRGWLTAGPQTRGSMWPLATLSKLKFSSFIVLYIIVAILLVVFSVATFWPFPLLLPETINSAAWRRIAQNPSALVTSVFLAISSSLVGIVLIISWFESQPRRRDQFILLLSAVALGLPTILLLLGQYRAFLHLNLTGTLLGLFLAHLIPVTAYMFIILVGPYRNFDPRWRASASGLLVGFQRYFWTLKLPMLKAPLLAAVAIGFAVSFGQYVPAQLIAAGRYSTLPMEAVTLTSGSNRPLTAAFALMLMLAPLLVFLAASHFSKPRWSAQ